MKGKTPIQLWFTEMQSIWLNKEPDRIKELLSDTLQWHESPFEPPLTSKDEVAAVWQTIKNQNIEYVEIELLHESADNVGVAIWKFKEKTSSEHIGMYFLRLDERGKCVDFKQCWNTDPSDQ